MSTGLRCPECGAPNRLVEAMNDSVLASTCELQLVDALRRIVGVAQTLVGARFAAIGVIDAESRFEAWVTAGARASEAPAVSGALAYVLRRGSSWATCDVAAAADAGGWPHDLPAVSSLLGVPIVASDEVVGAFYLGNEDRWGFTPEQRRLVELIAPHAAAAVARARLHERSRELTVLQERTRLARELHDSVTQALFSMRLAADTALAIADDDPDGSRTHVERLSELSRTALAEMRALLAELRPPEVEAHGIVESLRNHVEVLRQVHGVDARFETDLRERLDARCENELFRLAQEALANAVKHSGANQVDVRLETGGNGTVRLTVRDDGCGFDPDAGAGRGHFGLTTMRERAMVLGGALSIESAPDGGTLLTVQVPR